MVEKTRGGGKTDEEEEQEETGVKEGRERSHIVHFSLSVWHPVCAAAPAAAEAYQSALSFLARRGRDAPLQPPHLLTKTQLTTGS